MQTTKIGGRYAGFAVFGSPMAPGADGYFGTGYKTTEKYQYDYDAENKKLLITYRLVPEKKRDKENFDVIGFHVFDEKMNKLWGGEFRMPYNEAIMDNSNFSVDSKGNAYMLAKVYDSESRRERDKSTDKPAYHFEVMKFTKDSKTPIIAKLSVGDFYIHETTITENTLHDMIIACTYSKKSKGTGTDGIFLATLDQAGKLIQFKNGYYEFPKEELQKFESARARRRIDRKDDYEAPNLKVRDVQVEADGSIFLACEEYRVVEHTSGSGMNGNRMSTYYTYHYEDIIGSRIDPAGKFQWVRKIPKMQRGRSGRGTMGFKLVSDASGYYFLYLDNLKNLDIAEDEPPKTHVDGYGGQVMVSRLTMDGKLSKELLFDTREEDIMIFPADFHKISGNRFIGRARLKRNLYQPLLITTK
ncbi:MAG: hypothetical protein H7Y27_15125 [Gemmatimonadaceae bacterium]|nr:hypothetical protein [Chitinophagaceae bacterium]